MPKEIELKLRLTSAEARRLPAHPVLADLKPQKYRLFNTYYDTPGLDLCRRGIALRLRRKGWTVWLMTVKGGGPAGGALAERSEWEAPTQPGVFDFGIVTDAGLREFLEAHQSSLRPVFSTDFTRTAWTILRSGSLIELALDRGRINAVSSKDGVTQLSDPICELELELVEGTSPDALFDVAIELAADLHLHPEIASKAERGYALARGAAMPPAKAFPSPATCAMTPVEAFRSIAFSCLLQLQRNESGAISGKDPEHVHQARVAIRRLRSTFGLFAPVLAPEFVEVYAPRWSALARRLGGARDWDVFLTETLAPLEKAFSGDSVLAGLRERSESLRARARSSAGEALAHRDYSQLLLAFSAALCRTGPPTIESHAPSADSSLRRFAARRLRKRAGTIERLASERIGMDDKRRHELRIAFKKLRYALDFFTPVLPRKRLAPYLAFLTKIQDLLGALNDLATASRLLGELHPRGEPEMLLRGWIAGRVHLLVLNLDSELRHFLGLSAPWRGKAARRGDR